MKKVNPVPSIDSLDRSCVGKMLSDDDMMAEITRFNNNYYHWEEVRYRVEDDMLDSTWVVMKMLRKGNMEHLKLFGIDYCFSMIPDFQESLHIIDICSSGTIVSGTSGYRNVQRYAASSLMEEAIASSQMEGASTTRINAKQMLRAGRKPKDRSEKMILNNYLAMEFLKTRLDEEMTVDLILEMHRTITSDTLIEGSEWEGRFREDNDTVVGDTQDEFKIYHIPPTYDRIPAMMQELCDFINDDGRFIHPIVKGIIIHYIIGDIHPFVNGNGRLARALFYWYTMKKDYKLMEFASISRIMKNSKTKYSLAYQYTESDGNDLTYFIRFNLICIIKAVEELRRYIERKTREQEETLNAIESVPELNLLESTILNDYAKEKAVFSIKEISSRYSVSYQTARNYVNHLLELNYVKAVGKERKTQLYVCTYDGIAKER